FSGGTVSPGGYYAANSTVMVTATPYNGFHLISWTNATAITGTNSATLTITSPTTVVANFAPNPVPAPPTGYVVTQIVANASAPRGKPINNSGQVVATSTVGALLWVPVAANGTVGDLAVIGNFPPPSINDWGQVVGTINGQAVLWQPSTANAMSGNTVSF